MKNLVSIFMTLIITSIINTPAALALSSKVLLDPYTKNVDSSIVIEGVTCIDDTIYLLSISHLYTLNADGSEIVQWELNTEPYIHQGSGKSYFTVLSIFHFNGELQALASRCQFNEDRSDIEYVDLAIYAITLNSSTGTADFSLVLPLEMGDWVTYEYGTVNFEVPAQHFFIIDQFLYGSSNFNNNQDSILQFDLTSGTLDFITVPRDTRFVTPYKDGKLLLQIGNPSMLQDMYFAEFKIDSAEAQPIISLPSEWSESIGYQYYDAEQDAIYFEYSEKLYRADLNTSQLTELGAVLVGDGGSAVPISMSDSTLLVPYPFMLVQIDLYAESNSTQLVVYGRRLEYARSAFLQKNGNIDLLFKDIDGFDIAQAMATRDSSVDIFVLNVNSINYYAVYNGGYMMPLSSSTYLCEFANDLYPFIREAVMRDGSLIAVPVYIQIMDYSPEYDEIAFNQVGLTMNDMPATWMEFLQLIERLPDILQEHPDISVFDPAMDVQNTRYMLLQTVISAYWNYISRSGYAQQFDTEIFRQLIEAFDAIDFNGLHAYGIINDSYNALFAEHRVLFPSFSGIRVSPSRMDDHFLTLRMEDDASPVLSVDLEIAFVNPFSNNIENSIAFLESAIESLDDENIICMIPDANDPIVNPKYEDELVILDTQIAAMIAHIEEVGESAQLRAALDELYQQREVYCAENQYLITKEEIEQFRALESYFSLQTYHLGVNSSFQNEFSDEILCYVQGEWNLEQLILNLDQQLLMAQKEG